MFGRSRPVVLEPYSGRRRRKLPGWLLGALCGVALGAAGVFYVQQEILPERLSPGESARIRAAIEKTEAERARLESELAQTVKTLDEQTAAARKASAELAKGRKLASEHRSEVQALLEALPPDPRGGAVEVRAARFEKEAGELLYHVVLSREKTGGKPFAGQMQFVLAGSRGGVPTSITPEPIAVEFDAYDSLRGRLALPEGFEPRQTTVNVLDKAGGKLQGMRILYVR